MARATVEDCLEYLPDRLELVPLGAQRAREPGPGARPAVPWNEDKTSLVALRETAAGKVDPVQLHDAPVRSL